MCSPYLGRKYDRAALLVEQAVTLKKNFATAWHSRGWVAVVSDLHECAFESFQQMTHLIPLDSFFVFALYESAFAFFLCSKSDEELTAHTQRCQLAAHVL